MPFAPVRLLMMTHAKVWNYFFLIRCSCANKLLIEWFVSGTEWKYETGGDEAVTTIDSYAKAIALRAAGYTVYYTFPVQETFRLWTRQTDDGFYFMQLQ